MRDTNLSVRTIFGGFIAAAAFLLVPCVAQSNSPVATESSRHSGQQQKSAETHPKLTADQERGLRLLKAAIAESAGLQPDMRAFVMWRASNAYAAIDAKEGDKFAEEAFIASEAIDDPREDDRCNAAGGSGDIKTWIQRQVLSEMLRKDKVADVERLLPKATQGVRSQTTSELVQHYVAKRDFDQAEAFLSRVADSDRYPLYAAAELMLALGPDRSAEKSAIFSHAISNFELHTDVSDFGINDVGRFLERTWRSVPAALTLDAVDKVLEQAKSEEAHWHVSMSSSKGSVVLNSRYALRLFELLPILEELDKDKAESLLRENTEVANQLQDYPNGLESLDSRSSYSFGNSNSSVAPIAGQQQLQAQVQDHVQEVVNQASADPASALANALVLPLQNSSQDFSPRAQALLGIAGIAVHTKQSIAKSALEDLTSIEDQLTLKELNGIATVPDMYLSLGDPDAAKKAIAAETKAAEKLYEHDTDTDDPNGAFKGTWPSTDLWRRCVRQATKISPAFGEEIIAGIQDSDIAALEKVSYAAALLGSAGTGVYSCRLSQRWV
jgi:hypothetical protein